MHGDVAELLEPHGQSLAALAGGVEKDLLAGVVKSLLARLTAQLTDLADTGDPRTALFEFFTAVVTQAAANRPVVEALAEGGVHVGVTEPLATLGDALAPLLTAAQRTGTVRPDVHLDTVLALLTATTQGALHGNWDADLRDRTLAVVFAGLRP